MKRVDIKVQGEDFTPEGCFQFGQSVILTVIASFGTDLSQDALASLSRGLFSGGLASMQSIIGEARAREVFAAFVGEADDAKLSLEGNAFEIGLQLGAARLDKITHQAAEKIGEDGLEALFAGLLTHASAIAGTYLEPEPLAGVLEALAARLRAMPPELREEVKARMGRDGKAVH